MNPHSDSQEVHAQRMPRSPLLARKSPFSGVATVLRPYFSLHNPRTWIFLTVFVLQIVLFLLGRSLPGSLSHATHFAGNATQQPSSSALISTNKAYSSASTTKDIDQCILGKIFVYDIPKQFNADLLENCHKLNPWGSRCDAVSNKGFGLQANAPTEIIPQNLAPAWYWTDQFTLEIIYHNRLLKHKCRTTDPESASAFYIPYYVGLDIDQYLWSNYSADHRDNNCRQISQWVQNQPYFKRSNGWNHFITMGRITWDFRRVKPEDWGAGCVFMPGLKNVTRLLIEKDPWDYFDIAVPYPTGFHPRSDNDVVLWRDYVRAHKRTTLFSFAGGTRGKIKNDFRGILLKQCNEESKYCKVVGCKNGNCSNSAILEAFLDSEFCLQPRGDSFTRRSMFDCMVAGSIPVFFWKRTAYLQYEWFLPSESESYSVFIHRNDVKNGTSIREVLEKYSEEEKRKMREKVVEYIPSLIYGDNKGLESMKDAFDVAIEGLLRRFKEQEKPGFKWK